MQSEELIETLNAKADVAIVVAAVLGAVRDEQIEISFSVNHSEIFWFFTLIQSINPNSKLSIHFLLTT